MSMTLKTKLAAAFGAFALGVLVLSALAINTFSSEHQAFLAYVNESSARLRLAETILDAASARAIGVRNLVLVAAPADREAEKLATLRAHERVSSGLSSLQQALAGAPGVTDQERSLFAALQRVEARYGPLAQRIVELVQAGQREEAIARMNNECRPLLAELVQAARAYAAHGEAQSLAQAQASEAAFATKRMLMILGCAGAVALAIGLALRLTRSITGPINRAVEVAQTVASGDLTSQIEIHSQDETGRLLTALKTMNDSLVAIVGNVRQGSDSIATGSAEIATGNTDLSERTERQASSLQQTAASMEQMNATVHKSAETARMATQLATSASAAALKGGEVVNEVEATMRDITASSRKIADIIGVIDGIAFQTNILALNAAVEAARAGEQGKGFAVVAGEVRNLAQRCAEAAKEIKALIGGSVQKVETGSRLAEGARASMDDIVQQVQRVSSLMAELSAATIEQTSGIGQVNDAVTQLDQATQQNAALVEQSAAAAESLQRQAARLAEVVSVFKLNQEQPRLLHLANA